MSDPKKAEGKPEKGPTVTIFNSSPHPRTVDFGQDGEGLRKQITVPSAKIDKMKAMTPGKLTGVPKATWDAVKDHLSGRFLASKGVLYAVEE